MKIILIVSSIEEHLLDLALGFQRKGHKLTVLVSSSEIKPTWALEEYEGVEILKLKTNKFNKYNDFHRLISEFIAPYVMLHRLKKSPFYNSDWDCILWHSPSIFYAPLVSHLNKRKRSKKYLILRDIFPQWAIDIGLLRSSIASKFLQGVARYNYSQADIIGIQSPGNHVYLKDWIMDPNRKLEILPNWLGEQNPNQCSIRISETTLKGRKIFVYAGNMGRAQGLDIFIRLAHKVTNDRNLGFLFVGEGSETKKLKELCTMNMLTNMLFLDEIPQDQIPMLFSQCVAGIVALHPKHTTHNIPGKFLAYLRSGLPVLANVNSNNDIVKLIYDEKIGEVCITNDPNDLMEKMLKLLHNIDNDVHLSSRCRNVFEKNYTVDSAVDRIVSSLSL